MDVSPNPRVAMVNLAEPIVQPDSVFDVWRSVRQADGYRLPTEAEWEYACRAKSATKYCFGDDESLLSQYAVYASDTSQPVSSRQPNGWGLFDMHGNVWEWTDDWSGKLESNPGHKVVDPAGPSAGPFRAMRGGAFSFYSPAVHLGSRGTNPPAGRN
ncbi:MAG: formylglycine-generating enzyme family protein [Pirellulaceae bacterium]|nr:formylglycine-generating enzyme family protein [Pirellulaceae bacterium]